MNRPAVYFSPRGGATAAIVAAVDAARHEVLCQAYSFTSAPVAKALIDAARRKVDVRLIVDGNQATGVGTVIQYVARAGVPVWRDSAHAIAHSKIIVVDGVKTISGSFNFSAAAETSNAENLLILTDHATAALYRANWLAHVGHSTPVAVIP